MENARVVALFDEIAALMEVAGENPFKIRAYKRAAEAVAAYSDPIEDVDEKGLRELEGIGEATSAKIREYVATGQMRYLERLREEYPPGLIEVLRVPGLGPKRVGQLYRERGISSVAALKQAIAGGTLKDVSGFGPKALKNIEQGIERLEQTTTELPLGDALVLAVSLRDLLLQSPALERVEIVGDLRRGCETVPSIELLARCDNFRSVLDVFTTLPVVLDIVERTMSYARVTVRGGFETLLRCSGPADFGAALISMTGSPAHLEQAENRALELGLAWGLLLAESSDEDGIYQSLQVPVIAPELREGRGEWQAALENALPQLLEVADIRGDLHAHSTWSDGVATIAQMAAAMSARGYQYFAVTDHSKALAMTNGLTAARLREQAKEIEAARAQFPDLLILRGVECDIMRDGSLDLDDEILHELDFVIGSVHSGFNLPRDEQTARMVRAISHPAVDLIAHPTGRILGGRPGYDVDVVALIEAAREHDTALEINASQRLDLSSENARLARDAGVLLAIDTDAHSTRMLGNIELGVITARRAWCETKNVLNCKSAEELKAWLQRPKAQH